MEGDAPAAQAQRLHLGSFFVARVASGGPKSGRGEKPCVQEAFHSKRKENILAFFQLLWHCMPCAVRVFPYAPRATRQPCPHSDLSLFSPWTRQPLERFRVCKFVQSPVCLVKNNSDL